MPFSYPVELREKVINAYLKSKGTQKEIADLFEINVSTVRRYLRKYEQGNDLAPRPNSGRRPTLDEEDIQCIKRQVEARPGIKLKELCELLKAECGKMVSEPTMCRACQRLDIRRNKKGR